ncbi:TerD family protein [Streptomyces sp. LP11]|uniref:TerD family protein n=1 Tax=Streptomyces pyxinicus TaxID=2970331 RepID=A0ABT2B461_9ACTN|nr:TerD family protein [Streptomyces sp. LP11]MCS0603308.1 TerD family protein [Streptomyces sp. LP11]
MTAELVRGQNHPLSRTRLTIRISAGVPVLAGATLGDENGTVHGTRWVARPGAPVPPGVEVSQEAAPEHRLAVDLAAVPESVHRVDVFLALPTGTAGPSRFGAAPAPHTAVEDRDGTELVGYTLTGLDGESAVIALELYRRQGAWKVRAMGQGYSGGLPALFADQGLTEAAELAASLQQTAAPTPTRAMPAPSSAAAPQDASAPGTAEQTPSYDPQRLASDRGTQSPVPDHGAQSPTPDHGARNPYDGPAPAAEPAPRGLGGPIDYAHPRRHSAPPPPPSAAPVDDGQPALPVAGDAVGWSMDERLYNQVWGMFEDLARTTAAYRSAVDFADSRLEKEVDQALADPRARLGTSGDIARDAAYARRTELVDQARAVLDRDLAQLTAEAEVVEPALPPAYAGWESPVWHGYRVPAEQPLAVRLGVLHLPESGLLRIPLLVRLPLERGLWIDSGVTEAPDDTVRDSAELRRLAVETAVTIAARLLAVHPPGEFAVHVVDPAGAGAGALTPLTGAGMLAAAPATGAAGVTDLLERLTRRVDLVQMAVRGGAEASLPADVDTARQLLIVNDFPHGFDERAVTRLRYLADEGPAVGVHLLLVADRQDAAAYGPLLDPLWRSLMRLTPVPDDHIADPWVGHAWTYEPSPVPPGSQIVRQVLAEVARARPKDR